MRIAISSDKPNGLTAYVVSSLEDRGHEVILLGALRKKGVEWVDSSRELAESVSSGKADQGVLFCWTGTGASIVANKIPGVRAALCTDPKQARGARKWDHANVLVMSLELTSKARAGRILDAWFSEPYGNSAFDRRNISKLDGLESRMMKK